MTDCHEHPHKLLGSDKTSGLRRREARVAAKGMLERALEAPTPRQEEDEELVFARALP